MLGLVYDETDFPARFRNLFGTAAGATAKPGTKVIA